MGKRNLLLSTNELRVKAFRGTNNRHQQQKCGRAEHAYYRGSLDIEGRSITFEASNAIGSIY